MLWVLRKGDMNDPVASFERHSGSNVAGPDVLESRRRAPRY